MQNKLKYTIIFLAAGIVVLAVFASWVKSPHKVQTSQSGAHSTNGQQFHYSYFSSQSFFDDAYTRASKLQHPAVQISSATPIKGILVNHHLLAAEFIAEEFNAVATDAPLTVLLVSPNHFSTGKGDVIMSDEPWQTPYGVLEPDTNTINNLQNNTQAVVDESPFSQEHGVSGIVPFIKKSLPNAKVVPVIFNNTMDLQKVLSTADSFSQKLPHNTLVVGSFDFSHYLPSRAADFHDQENLVDVESFNFSSLYNLDIDSRPGLAFFLELLKDSGTQNFHLLENSNSAKLSHQDILETTSYIDGYFTPGIAATATVNTTLVLPPIDSSSAVNKSLDRTSSTWSIEYLERLMFGQDTTRINIFGDASAITNSLQRYTVNSITTNQSQASFDMDQWKIIVNYHAAQESITQNKNTITINQSRDLLSDAILKTGGTSITYGLAEQSGQLSITVLPIGVEKGLAKLLIGAQNGIVLAELAKNSPADLRNQIKTGVVVFKP